jgi:hypothetical protein
VLPSLSHLSLILSFLFVGGVVLFVGGVVVASWAATVLSLRMINYTGFCCAVFRGEEVMVQQPACVTAYQLIEPMEEPTACAFVLSQGEQLDHA